MTQRKYTDIFFILYLAFLYLAEADLIIPSPRNHTWGFLILATALSGNGQSVKSKVFTTITFLIPTFKIRKTDAAPTEFWILSFASYNYFFNSKIQNSKIGRGSGRVFNFELG